MHNCNIIATSPANNSTAMGLRLDSALMSCPSSASLGKLAIGSPTSHFTGNLVPHSWYKTFTTASGRPDVALISILSEIVYWYRPSKAGSSKFTGSAWQTSYDYFEGRFGYSRETIRRVFVKLEALGIASRELRMVKSFGQKYNNVLFVHLNSDKLSVLTKSSSFKLNEAKPPIARIRLDDATEINLSACEDRSKKVCFSSPKNYTPSPQIVIGYIEEENILENNKISIDQGISNFANPSFSESNLELETAKLNQITNLAINEQKNESEKEKVLEDSSNTETPPSLLKLEPEQLDKTINAVFKPNTKSQATSSRKPLLAFHPLSEMDAIFLRKASNRPFNLSFINKLLLKLADQYPNHGFYKKSLLLSYLTEALRGEKHDAEVANRDNFYFKPKEGTPRYRKILQSNYLKAIEQSMQTDPITRIKRKIIGLAGDDEYAYHLITNCTMPYIPSNNPSNKGISNLTLKITNLITQDQIKILTKAAKEVLGQGVDLIFKNKDPYLKSNSSNTSLEVVTTSPEPAAPSSLLWQKIRGILKNRFGEKGEALDKSWFAKLDIELKASEEANPATSIALSSSLNKYETKENQIKIKCPNSFTKDWIKTNYGNAIEDAMESAIEYTTGQFTEIEYKVVS